MQSPFIREETARLYITLRALSWGRWLLVALGILVAALDYAPWSGSVHGQIILIRASVIVGLYAILTLGAQILIRFSKKRSYAFLRWTAAGIFCIDFIFFTIALWVTGGVESPVFILYFIGLVIAAFLFQTAGILLSGVAAMALYTGLLMAEFSGWIPHRTTSGLFSGVFADEGATKTLASVIDSGFVAITLLAALVSRQIHIQEREIVHQRAYLEKTIEKLRDGLIFLDEWGKILSLNPRAEEILQISEETIIGKEFDLASFVSGERKEKEKARQLLTRYNTVFTLTVFGVVERIVEAIHVRLTDKEGRVSGSMIIFHDVTREHAMAKTKNEFISIAAHQLRTPLSAIKWTMESVLSEDMGKLSDEQRRFLRRASEANERMIHLVNDLLNIARIEEGRFGYRMKRESIEALVRDVVESMRLKADAKRIRIATQFPKRLLPPFPFDRERLHLAIQNILDNALSYTQEGGTVQVQVWAEGKAVKIMITDTGIGIPQHQLPRLFTKFFRADNALKVKTDGTGLGLYLARNIVRYHGGDIAATSKEGEGSVFTITLPTAHTETPRAAASSSSIEAQGVV